MASRLEVAGALFVDITNEMVQHKADKGLLNRFSELTAEGHEAPVAWYAAMHEAGVKVSPEQTARLRSYMLMGDESKASKPGPYARGRASAGSPPDVEHAA